MSELPVYVCAKCGDSSVCYRTIDTVGREWTVALNVSFIGADNRIIGGYPHDVLHWCKRGQAKCLPIYRNFRVNSRHNDPIMEAVQKYHWMFVDPLSVKTPPLGPLMFVPSPMQYISMPCLSRMVRWRTHKDAWYGGRIYG